jgi:hypothetical protein
VGQNICYSKKTSNVVSPLMIFFNKEAPDQGFGHGPRRMKVVSFSRSERFKFFNCSLVRSLAVVCVLFLCP